MFLNHLTEIKSLYYLLSGDLRTASSNPIAAKRYNPPDSLTKINFGRFWNNFS